MAIDRSGDPARKRGKVSTRGLRSTSALPKVAELWIRYEVPSFRHRRLRSQGGDLLVVRTRGKSQPREERRSSLGETRRKKIRSCQTLGLRRIGSAAIISSDIRDPQYGSAVATQELLTFYPLGVTLPPGLYDIRILEGGAVILREDLPPEGGRGHMVIVDGAEYAHVVHLGVPGSKDHMAPGEMLTWSTDLTPDEVIDVASQVVGRIETTSPASAFFTEQTADADWIEGELGEVLDFIRGRLSRIALLNVALSEGQELRWRRSAARLVQSEVEHGEASLTLNGHLTSLAPAEELMARTATQGIRRHLSAVQHQLHAG